MRRTPSRFRRRLASPQLLDALRGLQADYTVLYQKVRHYHWDIYGSGFFALHPHFGVLYGRVDEIIDNLAERIRGLGGAPVRTLDEALSLAHLQEDPTCPPADQIVVRLQADFESLSAAIKEVLDFADPATTNLLEDLVQQQEKDTWMLRQFLQASEETRMARVRAGEYRNANTRYGLAPRPSRHPRLHPRARRHRCAYQ